MTPTEETEEDQDPFVIDFSWVVFVGMQIGFSQREIARMRFSVWCDLFEHFKKMHNMTMQKMIFAEPKKAVSILDL